MTRSARSRPILLAALSLALLAGFAPAALADDADNDQTKELRRRIDQLEREIARIKDDKDDAAQRRRDRIQRERRLALRLISLDSELSGVIDAAAPLYPQRDAARNELAAAMAEYERASAELEPLRRKLDALARIVEQRRRDVTKIESGLAEDQATAPAMFEARAVLAGAREDLARAERIAAERIAADTIYRELSTERTTVSLQLAEAGGDGAFDRAAAAHRMLQLDDLMSKRAGQVADLTAQRDALREAKKMLELREDDARATIAHDPLRVAAVAQVDAAQAEVDTVEPVVRRLEAQVAAADTARRLAAATLDDLTRRIAGLELRALQLRREIAWLRGELRL